MIDGLSPDVLTVQSTYDFSGFFNKALNICLYKSLDSGHTLIDCFMMSSVSSGAVRTVGFFVNFKNSLKDEILYTVHKIQGQD